jgi:hypothetical protein
MAQEKEKPTVETVQQEITASDLLMYEVCAPLKEQLDKIKVCTPSLAVCLPNESCLPSPCLPDVTCSPIEKCPPNCKPVIPPLRSCEPGDPGLTPSLLRQKLLVSDLEQLNAEVEELKKQIHTLRGKK